MSTVALPRVLRFRPTVRRAVDQTRCLRAATSLQPSHRLQCAMVGARLRFLVGDHLCLRARASRRHDHSPDAAPGSLRLLHCCGQFAATQGGTERQARAVCAALAARGHSVSVLARKTSEVGQAVPGVTLHARIRAIDRGRFFGLANAASDVSQLAREVRQTDVLAPTSCTWTAWSPSSPDGSRAGRERASWPRPAGDLDLLRQTAGGALRVRLLLGLDTMIASEPDLPVGAVGGGVSGGVDSRHRERRGYLPVQPQSSAEVHDPICCPWLVGDSSRGRSGVPPISVRPPPLSSPRGEMGFPTSSWRRWQRDCRLRRPPWRRCPNCWMAGQPPGWSRRATLLPWRLRYRRC